MATSVKVAMKKKLFTTQDAVPATELLKELKKRSILHRNFSFLQ